MSRSSSGSASPRSPMSSALVIDTPWVVDALASGDRRHLQRLEVLWSVARGQPSLRRMTIAWSSVSCLPVRLIARTWSRSVFATRIRGAVMVVAAGVRPLGAVAQMPRSHTNHLFERFMERAVLRAAGLQAVPGRRGQAWAPGCQGAGDRRGLGPGFARGDAEAVALILPPRLRGRRTPGNGWLLARWTRRITPTSKRHSSWALSASNAMRS